MTRSLRGRLLLSTAIGAILVLSASGVILYLLMRASLVREFDASLLAKGQGTRPRWSNRTETGSSSSSRT